MAEDESESQNDGSYTLIVPFSEKETYIGVSSFTYVYPSITDVDVTGAISEQDIEFIPEDSSVVEIERYSNNACWVTGLKEGETIVHVYWSEVGLEDCIRFIVKKYNCFNSKGLTFASIQDPIELKEGVITSSVGVPEVYNEWRDPNSLSYDCSVLDVDYKSYGTSQNAAYKIADDKDNGVMNFTPTHSGTYQFIWRSYYHGILMDEKTVSYTINTLPGLVFDGGVPRVKDCEGKYVASGTPLVNGEKYYVEDGIAQAGWLYLGDWKMYFDTCSYTSTVGMKEIEGHRYLFNADGVMQTFAGTPVVDGKKYWVNTEGFLGTEWLYLLNWKMYFDPETCQAAIGFKEINGKMYLFDGNGVMQNYAGTTIVNGKKYWFSTDDASLKTGWLILCDWKLYFDPDTYEAYTSIIVEIPGYGVCQFDDNGVAILIE